MEGEGEEQGRMARILSRWVGVDMLLSPVSPMTQVSRMSSSLSLELGSCDPAAAAPAPQQRGTKQRKVIPIGRRTVCPYCER